MIKRPCKRCGEEIAFIVTKSGAHMPINPGRIIVHEPIDPITLVTDAGEVVKTKTKGDQGYEPHWATCPFAKEFKRK